VKHKNLYYLFYSANDFRNVDYAVGYATSNHPLGPWIKHPGNPILNKSSIGYNGPGHGDLLIDRRNLYYVFHTHSSDLSVAPRKTALVRAGFDNNKSGADSLRIDPASFYFLLR